MAGLTTSHFRKPAGIVLRAFVLLFSLGPATALATSAELLFRSDQPAFLDKVITNYEALVARGGWSVVPEGPVLTPGVRHEHVRLLRNRLRATGEYDADVGADPLWYDDLLAAATQNFKERHGLSADATVDRLTRQRLNVTAEERLAQLRHSRAQLPLPTTSERRVLVNIPEAVVAALENNQTVFTMAAIVGHPSRPTPELSSRFNRVVVNPPWSVPRSIAVRDILPRQQEDSGYLARNQIRVYMPAAGTGSQELAPDQISWDQLNSDHFPYILRQDPGTFNALGKYKFDFPNEHDVYLHDTPGRDLLGLSYRTLSSGCVRLAEPAKLANWLAGGAGLQSAELLDAGSTRSVPVTEAVTVELVYVTAWVSPIDGKARFRPDIYDRIGSTTPQVVAN